MNNSLKTNCVKFSSLIDSPVYILDKKPFSVEKVEINSTDRKYVHRMAKEVVFFYFYHIFLNKHCMSKYLP